MVDNEIMPELKQVLGALIFAANRSLGVSELKKCLLEVAKEEGGVCAAFAEVQDSNIEQALEELSGDLVSKTKTGFHLVKIAGGYRFQSDIAGSRWVKHLLDIGRPNRLSRPALETMAIIAYRQPISKAQIEGIRGVNVDHIVKNLLELHLIKIVDRSDLPGRPFLYGTTQSFLEYFGLRDIKDLREIEPMLLLAADENAKKKKTEPELLSPKSDINEQPSVEEKDDPLETESDDSDDLEESDKEELDDEFDDEDEDDENFNDDEDDDEEDGEDDEDF